MSKITIIEGNSNDKDNVRNFMVKGEPGNDGVSPSATVTRGTGKATIDVTDKDGTTSADVNDGVSPTIEVSKTGGTTTITITDFEGTKTATILDGEVSEAELNAAITTLSESTSERFSDVNQDINDISNTLNTVAEQIFPEDKFAVVTGSVTLTNGEGEGTINYPAGFTKDNCIVLAVGKKLSTNPLFTYSFGILPDVGGTSTGAVYHRVSLGTDNISLKLQNYTSSGSQTFNYQVTLLRIS